ncbi:MAG: DUF362 domain-containing protein [Nanoarchaeota archaeon]|nr:DUF362 domain-containing protein [Nanoarchaeota archaeon]
MVDEVKGASIKFKSYEETVPKILDLLKLQRELKKYDKIVLKPNLANSSEESTSREFTEAVLKFCLEHKNPVAEIFIAEGVDGADSGEVFEYLGYGALAEKYSVGLVDLNKTETKEIEDFDFSKFSTIHYPKILLESLIISLPKLCENEETVISGSLSNMLGAFPAEHYKGFFSKEKSKIRKWPIKYSIHDIVKCKFPDFAVVDASSQGVILAGLPLEIDKQAAKLLGKNWKEIPYLKMIEESLTEKEEKDEFEWE